MANPSDRKAATLYAALLTFTWGTTPTIRRYANFTSNLTVDGQVFTAVPEIEIDYGDQHGGTQDVPMSIDMLQTIEPVSLMVGQKFTPTEVLIQEVDPLDIPNTLRTMFKGRVWDCFDNFTENPDIARIVVNGHRAKLAGSLGLPMGQFCPWTFGMRPCKSAAVNLATLKQTGTITSVAGTNLVITGLTQPRDYYFNDGSVTVDGYEIEVRYHQSGTTLEMMGRAPAHWAGASCIVTPGCDKSPGNCGLWVNLTKFGGMGLAMPLRHPQIDSVEE